MLAFLLNYSQSSFIATASFILVFSSALIIYMKGWRNIYNPIYAYFLSKWASINANSNELNSIKTELFASLEPQKQIVEIGAGTGMNMPFYPPSSAIKCVEPKKEFESYLAKSIVHDSGKHLLKLEFVAGSGESLSKIISPESVDYVVCTFVLCSVTDVRSVVSEVKKILKPGGVFYFLEHIQPSDEHLIKRIFSTIFTYLSRVVADNCHWNRDFAEDIKSADFSTVSYNRHELGLNPNFILFRWISFGYAIK